MNISAVCAGLVSEGARDVAKIVAVPAVAGFGVAQLKKLVQPLVNKAGAQFGIRMRS